MSTVVTQTLYGENAEQAAKEVESSLALFENRLSLYNNESDIARLNAAAGNEWVQISPDTANLLRKSVELSATSEDAFAITIAPITLAWGITGETPRVPPEEEIAGMLTLVDDKKLEIADGEARLPQAGMAVDLGGIAKGAACTLVEEIYDKYNVKSALLNIGGNVYAMGTKPDGSLWRIGFRDPASEADVSIASLQLQDAVFSVSGGYERYFEQDGVRYIHILDPRTGRPAQSDVVSVGVVDKDGAVADFYSTTFFVLGTEKALGYMRQGGDAVVLDNTGTLYVSEGLQEGFQLYPEYEDVYNLVYIEKEGYEN